MHEAAIVSARVDQLAKATKDTGQLEKVVLRNWICSLLSCRLEPSAC